MKKKNNKKIEWVAIKRDTIQIIVKNLGQLTGELIARDCRELEEKERVKNE